MGGSSLGMKRKKVVRMPWSQEPYGQGVFFKHTPCYGPVILCCPVSSISCDTVLSFQRRPVTPRGVPLQLTNPHHFFQDFAPETFEHALHSTGVWYFSIFERTTHSLFQCSVCIIMNDLIHMQGETCSSSAPCVTVTSPAGHMT